MSNIKTLDNIVKNLRTLKSELAIALMRANRICPECEGTNLNSTQTKCWDYSSEDYS